MSAGPQRGPDEGGREEIGTETERGIGYGFGCSAGAHESVRTPEQRGEVWCERDRVVNMDVIRGSTERCALGDVSEMYLPPRARAHPRPVLSYERWFLGEENTQPHGTDWLTKGCDMSCERSQFSLPPPPPTPPPPPPPAPPRPSIGDAPQAVPGPSGLNSFITRRLSRQRTISFAVTTNGDQQLPPVCCKPCRNCHCHPHRTPSVRRARCPRPVPAPAVTTGYCTTRPGSDRKSTVGQPGNTAEKRRGSSSANSKSKFLTASARQAEGSRQPQAVRHGQGEDGAEEVEIYLVGEIVGLIESFPFNSVPVASVQRARPGVCRCGRFRRSVYHEQPVHRSGDHRTGARMTGRDIYKYIFYQISLSVLFRFNLIFRKPISHAAAEERPDQEHLRLIAIDTEMPSVAIEIKYDDKLTDKNVF
ncbi:Sec24B protein [Culex quinquefasciatus]|uniref:Sec24B protein n=1 Tax=Culex quinquefasciatus TaxID=7176 RepID=B0XC10_CULQU|nr:Sec24B protein [Culex quinquefasciatus]|eukprot:XP_001867182.1 Sec24B protein [Culex quinquefasciatus]